jgi:hypothetical protein
MQKLGKSKIWKNYTVHSGQTFIETSPILAGHKLNVADGCNRWSVPRRQASGFLSPDRDIVSVATLNVSAPSISVALQKRL